MNSSHKYTLAIFSYSKTDVPTVNRLNQMIKYEGNQSYKYCDWCGKYCDDRGIDTWRHNFCSERCRIAYDNAHGTVDGGYREGSVGQKLHKAWKKFIRIVEIIAVVLIGGLLLLELIAYLIKQ